MEAYWTALRKGRILSDPEALLFLVVRISWSLVRTWTCSARGNPRYGLDVGDSGKHRSVSHPLSDRRVYRIRFQHRELCDIPLCPRVDMWFVRSRYRTIHWSLGKWPSSDSRQYCGSGYNNPCRRDLAPICKGKRLITYHGNREYSPICIKIIRKTRTISWWAMTTQPKLGKGF